MAGLTLAYRRRTPRRGGPKVSTHQTIKNQQLKTNLLKINDRIPRIAPQQGIRGFVLMKFNGRIHAPFDPSKIVHRKNAAVAFAVGFVVLNQSIKTKCTLSSHVYLNNTIFQSSGGESDYRRSCAEKLVLQQYKKLNQAWNGHICKPAQYHQAQTPRA